MLERHVDSEKSINRHIIEQAQRNGDDCERQRSNPALMQAALDCFGPSGLAMTA